MAMVSGGGRGGGGYSYSSTKTYSLMEAIEQASGQFGSLEPDFAYSKLPPALQAELDRLANHRFFGSFVSLNRDRQRMVMGTLKVELQQQQNENKSNPLSLLDILTFARDGIAEPEKIVPLLPEEIKKMLDASAQEQGAGTFKTASSRQQVAILDTCVQMLIEAEVEARQASRKAEEEARREAEEAKRRSENLCIVCGLRLGFFNRLLRRDQHPRCVARQD